MYCKTMHNNLICRILGLKWRGCQKKKLYLLLNSMLQRRACIPFILLMTSTSLLEWQGICSDELLLIIIKGLCYHMMTLLPCWCVKICFSLFSPYQKALCGTDQMSRIVRVHSTHTVYRQIQIYYFPRFTLFH